MTTTSKTKPAFVSWSGGKDSCLAAYRARASGLEVCSLLNMAAEDGKRSRSHGLSSSVLQTQARAMGITLVQRPAAWDTYEAEFISVLKSFKQQGINDGIFGDIDFNAHREWVDRICFEAGIVPHLPLWEEDQNKLLSEFITLGFEAVVVATRADILGEEWLGRKIDAAFVRDLAELGKTKPITPCGEAGEYHTLVTSGPLFNQRIELLKTRKTLREEHWFLEILDAGLKNK